MKRNVYIMYAISLLQGMVFYAPIATLYRTAQGLSVFQITLTESLFFILCLVIEIPWGIIADKIGYKKTMVFCCGLYFVSKIVFWQASGFIWFLLERIILGIVFAGLSGVDTSILYLSCEEGESQKSFGIYNSLGTIGLLISAIIYSTCIKENYKLAGFLTVISYGISMVMSLYLVEVKKQENKHCKKDKLKKSIVDYVEESCKEIRKIIRNKKLLYLLIAVAFISETCHVVTVFLNQLKYESCGLSASVIGYVYVIATIVSLCGVFSDFVTKKAGEQGIGKLIIYIVTISCLLLAFTQKAGVSIISILLLQISNSIFQPLQLELQNRQVSTKNRATVLSINAMFIDCISIVINLILGYIAQINLTIAFLFGAGICFLELLYFRKHCIFNELTLSVEKQL